MKNEERKRDVKISLCRVYVSSRATCIGRNNLFRHRSSIICSKVDFAEVHRDRMLNM